MKTLILAAALPLSLVAETPRLLGPLAGERAATPAPAQAPPPEYIPKRSDILSSQTTVVDGQRITIQEIKPIPLPEPPPPAPVTPLDPARLAALRENLPPFRISIPLYLSATIYRREGKPPVSHVIWWPTDGGGLKQDGTVPEISFWSTADFSLLSGIGSFADSQGTEHSFSLGWGFSGVAKEDGTLIPNLPAKPAIYHAEDELTPEQTILLDDLHKLYQTEHARLQAAFIAGEKSRKARAAEEAERRKNPPPPEPITLRYWRTEKPSSTNTEGGDQ